MDPFFPGNIVPEHPRILITHNIKSETTKFCYFDTLIWNASCNQKFSAFKFLEGQFLGKFTDNIV